jgi:hypothetical protein
MCIKYKLPLSEVMGGIEKFVLNGNMESVVIEGDSNEKSLLIRELEAKKIPYSLSEKYSGDNFYINLTKIQLT